MSDRPQQGCSEAHTRAPGAGDRAAEGGEAAAAELPGADPAELLSGLPEEEAVDVLELIAETALAPRRARGGSPARRTARTAS